MAACSLPRYTFFAPRAIPAFLLRPKAASTAAQISGMDSLIPDMEDSVHAATAPVGKPRGLFPKRGEELELVCESLAFKGIGVCKVSDTGFVVMCNKALPGERFLGRIVKKKGSYAEAQKLKTIEPHDNAVVPPCQYAKDCGGCKTQALAYEAQLAAKEDQVYQLISRVGHFEFNSVESSGTTYFKQIVACPIQYHYRNKMEFSFGAQKWTPSDDYVKVEKQGELQPSADFALGLHAPGRYDKILNIRQCLLQDGIANQILDCFHTFWENNLDKMPPYDTSTHQGFLRHLMIRTGRHAKTRDLQLMVNFVTSEYKPHLLQPIVNDLVARYPEVVSVVNNVTSSLSNMSTGEHEYVLFGVRTITDCLRGLVFEISANSFFQTNTTQAEVLYKLVEESCRLKGDGTEIILDLFCGTGTIGLSMAKKVKHIYGYEVVPEAVADACQNAQRNGIDNATFVRGDLNKISADFGKDFPKPDVVITDPNRPGMHPKLIKFLINLRAPRVVYVSCNPATCARDLDYLCHDVEGSKGCYRLVSVQPVDMFPHTPHIECVCELVLDSSNLDCKIQS